MRTFILLAAAIVACAPATIAQRKPAPVLSYKVVATFPHDTTSFTQGLVYADGEFYESTGLNGQSTLRRVEIATGKTLQRIDVPKQYFAEGLALVGDELLQLTWQHRLGFVRRESAPDATTFYDLNVEAARPIKTFVHASAMAVQGGVV